MRVIFMGTPEFSVATLVEIIGQGHEVVAVYSQPPRKAGRGMEFKKTPVHEKAEQFGLPVFTPEDFKKTEDRELFKSHQADVAIIVAYGLLLPIEILEAPAHGCLNLHASLLPRWRGAAPINRAIMEGDKETGIMVMQMEEGLDTGPIAMAERFAISEKMTAGELHDYLKGLGSDLMVRTLAALERGTLETQEQAAEGVLYAHKLQKSETRIDWKKNAEEVHNHIRGLAPFPGAWCEVTLGGKTHRLKVLKSELVSLDEAGNEPALVISDNLDIACGKGIIRLLSVQRSGKGVMSAEEFLRGHALQKGMYIA